MSTFPIFHGIRLADNSAVINFNVGKFVTDPEIAKNEEGSKSVPSETPVVTDSENSQL
jgi:hypothetical protein